MNIAVLILLIVLGALLIFGVLPVFVLSYYLYSVLLVRNKPGKWGRECSAPDDDEIVRMFNIGMEWDKLYGGYKHDVSVTSDGFRLVGEYFDFGNKKAAIIIPGRMESLLYSYYFAEPYRKAGYNILVIDNRAHGLSEGKYSCLGYREYRDIIEWSRYLHDTGHAESIVLHGICIGSSVALFTLTAPECPEYIRAMTAEGMYTCFAESFKKHIIEMKKPLFPIYQCSLLMMRIFSHADVVHDGPIYRIGRLNKPILFLHSREDIYSMPDKVEELEAACTAPKRMVWFPTGAHSRIRINHTEKYDSAIEDFLAEFVKEPLNSREKETV